MNPMKKPSTQHEIDELKQRVGTLLTDRHQLSLKLSQTELDLANVRDALQVANRRLADAAAESRQWQARFDQLLTAISKR